MRNGILGKGEYTMGTKESFSKARVFGAVLDSGVLSGYVKQAKDSTKRVPRESGDEPGKYVKKSGDLFVEFLLQAMTKSGAVEIIRKSSDPELAARIVFSIRNAAQKHGS